MVLSFQERTKTYFEGSTENISDNTPAGKYVSSPLEIKFHLEISKQNEEHGVGMILKTSKCQIR